VEGEPQQPVVEQREKDPPRGGDAGQTGGRAGEGGGFSQAFIDQVHESLKELRVGSRTSVATSRSNFFN